MSRVKRLTYKNKYILLIDFSDLKASEVLPVISEAKSAIAQHPKQSVLTLTDVSRMGFNASIIQAFKEYVIHNKPYVKAAALVGAEGLIHLCKSGVESASSRKFVNFATRPEAQEWLIQQ